MRPPRPPTQASPRHPKLSGSKEIAQSQHSLPGVSLIDSERGKDEGNPEVSPNALINDEYLMPQTSANKTNRFTNFQHHSSQSSQTSMQMDDVECKSQKSESEKMPSKETSADQFEISNMSDLENV